MLQIDEKDSGSCVERAQDPRRDCVLMEFKRDKDGLVKAGATDRHLPLTEIAVLVSGNDDLVQRTPDSRRDL